MTEVSHPFDRQNLMSLRADLTDDALLKEYWEYRSPFTEGGNKGMLPEAILLQLRVNQKRRLAAAQSPPAVKSEPTKSKREPAKAT